jgi:hypothetical protein
MLDFRLFIGICQTHELEFEFKKMDPLRFNHFTSGGLYLEKIRSTTNETFYGKFSPETPTLEELLMLEANVKSLFKKLLPSLIKPLSFQIVPIPKDG